VYDGNDDDDDDTNDDDSNDDNENEIEINENNDNDAENNDARTKELPGIIIEHHSITEATAETDADTQYQETT
jgi:hypothetical protein